MFPNARSQGGAYYSQGGAGSNNNNNNNSNNTSAYAIANNPEAAINISLVRTAANAREMIVDSQKRWAGAAVHGSGNNNTTNSNNNNRATRFYRSYGAEEEGDGGDNENENNNNNNTNNNNLWNSDMFNAYLYAGGGSGGGGVFSGIPTVGGANATGNASSNIIGNNINYNNGNNNNNNNNNSSIGGVFDNGSVSYFMGRQLDFNMDDNALKLRNIQRRQLESARIFDTNNNNNNNSNNNNISNIDGMGCFLGGCSSNNNNSSADGKNNNSNDGGAATSAGGYYQLRPLSLRNSGTEVLITELSNQYLADIQENLLVEESEFFNGYVEQMNRKSWNRFYTYFSDLCTQLQPGGLQDHKNNNSNSNVNSGEDGRQSHINLLLGIGGENENNNNNNINSIDGGSASAASAQKIYEFINSAETSFAAAAVCRKIMSFANIFINFEHTDSLTQNSSSNNNDATLLRSLKSAADAIHDEFFDGYQSNGNRNGNADNEDGMRDNNNRKSAMDNEGETFRQLDVLWSLFEQLLVPLCQSNYSSQKELVMHYICQSTRVLQRQQLAYQLHRIFNNHHRQGNSRSRQSFGGGRSTINNTRDAAGGVTVDNISDERLAHLLLRYYGLRNYNNDNDNDNDNYNTTSNSNNNSSTAGMAEDCWQVIWVCILCGRYGAAQIVARQFMAFEELFAVMAKYEENNSSSGNKNKSRHGSGGADDVYAAANSVSNNNNNNNFGLLTQEEEYKLKLAYTDEENSSKAAGYSSASNNNSHNNSNKNNNNDISNSTNTGSGNVFKKVVLFYFLKGATGESEERVCELLYAFSNSEVCPQIENAIFLRLSFIAALSTDGVDGRPQQQQYTPRGSAASLPSKRGVGARGVKIYQTLRYFQDQVSKDTNDILLITGNNVYRAAKVFILCLMPSTGLRMLLENLYTVVDAVHWMIVLHRLCRATAAAAAAASSTSMNNNNNINNSNTSNSSVIGAAPLQLPADVTNNSLLPAAAAGAGGAGALQNNNSNNNNGGGSGEDHLLFFSTFLGAEAALDVSLYLRRYVSIFLLRNQNNLASVANAVTGAFEGDVANNNNNNNSFTQNDVFSQIGFPVESSIFSYFYKSHLLSAFEELCQNDAICMLLFDKNNGSAAVQVESNTNKKSKSNMIYSFQGSLLNFHYFKIHRQLMYLNNNSDNSTNTTTNNNNDNEDDNNNQKSAALVARSALCVREEGKAFIRCLFRVGNVATQRRSPNRALYIFTSLIQYLLFLVHHTVRAHVEANNEWNDTYNNSNNNAGGGGGGYDYLLGAASYYTDGTLLEALCNSRNNGGGGNTSNNIGVAANERVSDLLVFYQKVMAASAQRGIQIFCYYLPEMVYHYLNSTATSPAGGGGGGGIANGYRPYTNNNNNSSAPHYNYGGGGGLILHSASPEHVEDFLILGYRLKSLFATDDAIDDDNNNLNRNNSTTRKKNSRRGKKKEEEEEEWITLPQVFNGRNRLVSNYYSAQEVHTTFHYACRFADIFAYLKVPARTAGVSEAEVMSNLLEGLRLFSHLPLFGRYGNSSFSNVTIDGRGGATSTGNSNNNNNNNYSNNSTSVVSLDPHSDSFLNHHQQRAQQDDIMSVPEDVRQALVALVPLVLRSIDIIFACWRGGGGGGGGGSGGATDTMMTYTGVPVTLEGIRLWGRDFALWVRQAFPALSLNVPESLDYIERELIR